MDNNLTPLILDSVYRDRLAAGERELRRQEELGILDAAWQQSSAPSPIARLRRWLANAAQRRDTTRRDARPAPARA